MSLILKVSAVIVMGASWSSGFVCDQYYSAERVELLVLRGSSRTNLQVVSQVPADPANYDILPSFGRAYDTLLTEFQSTCNQSLLQPAVIYKRDSNEAFARTPTNKWTQFAPQVNFGGEIKDNVFLIKNTSTGATQNVVQMVGNEFVGMYGAYQIIDTIKTATGSDSALRTSILGVQSVFDTTNFYDLYDPILTQGLPTPNTVRTMTLHFLTVYYDSAGTSGALDRSSADNRLQIKYNVDRVLIHTPASQRPPGAIQLYSLTGRKIRELRSDTRDFEWDGTSERGEEMPWGVYLIEAEGGFVGKVIYSRSAK